MKILFVGGTGNISTSCVEWALAQGHEVGILTRGRRPSPYGPAVALLVGDRDDPRTLREAAQESSWDAVLDFVAFRPPQVDAAVEALSGRVGQYVFISSASVYRKPPARPAITEDMPLENPFWEYARLKIACEDRLLAAHRDRGFPMTIVRPSYTYGRTWIPSGFGGQDYTVVGRMRLGLPVVCHGDGTSLWVMTHARDFAVGLGGLLGRREAIGEAFHITSDEVLTWSQIYEAMARAAGVEARLVHVPSALIAALLPERGGSLLGDKAHSAMFDNSKLRRVVPAYRARVTFAAGIAESIAWFDEDPVRRVVNAAMNEAIERVLAAQRRAWEGVRPAAGA
jgi:nucleoside-diphosphate-sugar epimerase